MLAPSCGGEGEDGPLGTAEEAQKICPGKSTIEGIDVASYQPNTDWAKVKADGITFAIIKATEGTGYTNPYFDHDWKGTKANGIYRGAYHFFRASVDPVAQADYFVGVMGALGADDLPPTIDLEVTDGMSASTVASRALTFLKEVEKKSGRTPIVYTGPSFFSSTLGEPAGFGGYPLWIANYGVSCPTVPPTWKKLTFWQYDDKPNINGVNGSGLDHDIFNGTEEDLKAFLGLSPTPTAAGQVNGNEALSVVTWPADDHAEVFVKDTSGELFHTYTKGGTDTWNPLLPLDTGAQCGFASVFWPDPKTTAQVFSPTSSSTTQSLQFDGKAWTKFSDFGGLGLEHIATLAWNDGHVEVFAQGTDRAIWHKYWQLASKTWSDWATMDGSVVTGANAILWGDGHGELFAADDAGVPYHNWSGSFPGGWHGWAKMQGEVVSRVVPVRWADGHVEVFGRDKKNHLVHSYVDAMLGDWIPFAEVSPGTTIQGDPSAIMNADGMGATAGPEVFARDASGKVVHLAWDGKQLGDFAKLGDQAASSDPLAWVRGDGSVEVLAIDDHGVLTHAARTSKGWSTWSPLGGAKLDACANEPSTTTSSSSSSGVSVGVGGGSSATGAGGASDRPAADHGGCHCEVPAGRDASNGWRVALATIGAAIVARRRRRAR